MHCPEDAGQVNLSFIYQTAVSKARRLAKIVMSTTTPEMYQQPIVLGNEAVSNVGKEGYEGFVTKLKEHILKGDIFQTVPSQRLARPTTLHPFNAYRHLRRINPSPYMFYLDCGHIQIVGASPETLCKVENNKVFNHAIAGTIKRGKTADGKPKFKYLGGEETNTCCQRTKSWAQSCLHLRRTGPSTSCLLTSRGTMSTACVSPARCM